MLHNNYTVFHRGNLNNIFGKAYATFSLHAVRVGDSQHRSLVITAVTVTANHTQSPA